MIDLTIKTLDSQNHAFSVEDDITVSQFKERIAEVINIPVDSQRLIYCGRVLQDNKKLQEYDVNGKVVHLVQRAPPSTTRRARSPQPSVQTHRRPFSTANAMYLGSMAFPSGLMEAQGIVPPPPTQSLSGSRLNVARRMIRRAENILNNLEDPQGSRNRESPPEEPQDDVTPVFAAQVFVPHSHNDDPLASLTAAVSAVENGILQAEQTNRAESGSEGNSTGNEPIPANSTVAETAAAVTTNTEEMSQVITEPPVVNTSASESAPNAENRNNVSNNTSGRLPENSFGTIEMSRLLDDLNKIHDRLRPFMDRYHAFMRNDPALNSEQVQNSRQTQTVINRVSEIMHLLGHAYHSLSDVMVQVSTPPPRPLLCRPILIQHSAVVQAGIPIQVEAQINLTHDRRPSDTTTNESPSGPTSSQPSETQTSVGTESSNTTVTSNAPSAPQPSITSSQIRPNVHEIRIDSFPFEFRGFPHSPVFNITHQSPRPPTSRGNNDIGTQATPVSGSETNTVGQQGPHEPVVAVVPPFVNNPNMEFFMEVTPESITIDSLETTVVTSAAQADNVLRGTFGSAPPEFIQSILQAVAGQMMGGAAATTPTTQTPSSTSSSTETSEQASTAQASSATNGSNVNSQARGNTQTHPTTATQTRSTSRPHVHLAQHTMQGFDPFLPCNSHHIRRRRVPTTAMTSMSTNAPATPTGTVAAETAGEQQNNNQFPNPLYNILQGWFRSLGNVNRTPRERNEQETANPSQNTTESTTSQPDFAELSRFIFETPGNSGYDLTLDTFLQNFPDHQYTEGESLFTDLVMTLARGLTFGDVIALNTGHIDPLVRIRPALRTFFRYRVLEGECPTQAAIDRGVNRLILELQPILELMNTMRVRDNIDIVESATQLCRSRFPHIISLLMSRMTGSLRSLVDHCLLTVRQLCALALHSCEDGQEGVEEVFRALIARYTVGIAPEIHQWTISTSLSQLRLFLRNLDVSSASIQPYIVLKSSGNENATVTQNSTEPEAMECEDVPIIETPVNTTTVSSLNSATLDSEPLPNVVIGSESWHGGLSAGWIPIITRDSQRQRRQNPQAPFSDAYLSGMPSKRRKIVAASKPHGSLSQVISDGVRRAITTTGLSNIAPLDVVSQAASSDLTLQSAYRDLLRTSVQSGLRDNPDFTPERFPNAANYFNLK